MPGDLSRLIKLSNARLLPNGDIAFTIETSNGDGDILCSRDDIGHLIVFLLTIAHASYASTEQPISVSQADVFAIDVPLEEMAMQGTDQSDSTMVILRVAGLSFGFRMPNANVSALAQDFARTAQTNSVPTRNPN